MANNVNDKIESCLEQIRLLEETIQNAAKQLSALKNGLEQLDLNVTPEPEPEPTPVVTANPIVQEQVVHPAQKNYPNLRDFFSLNDWFRLRRYLFNGDISRMDEVIDHLNQLQSLEESTDYLHSCCQWDWKDETVIAFMELLEQRFHWFR
jgi:hypothetical protein